MSIIWISHLLGIKNFKAVLATYGVLCSMDVYKTIFGHPNSIKGEWSLWIWKDTQFVFADVNRTPFKGSFKSVPGFCDSAERFRTLTLIVSHFNQKTHYLLYSINSVTGHLSHGFHFPVWTLQCNLLKTIIFYWSKILCCYSFLGSLKSQKEGLHVTFKMKNLIGFITSSAAGQQTNF